MEKMRMASADMTAQHIDQIAELFPNCITETVDNKGKPKKAINFEMLKQMLADEVLDGDEAYEFTWVGKKAAMVEANKPISKTLRPCPEESVNWDTTENLYIEGDNLEVLKLLQESYLGKVKMIYIDPPYNTGNDFIYNDDFKMTAADYADENGEFDDDGNRLFKNTETNGRFHSDWCSMIYSRLMLARHLLSDDGVIFISIDDNEQANLKKICDEVFGAGNFVAQMVWKKKQGGGNDSNHVVIEHEYIIAYTKNLNILKLNLDKKHQLDDSLYPFTDENGSYGLVTLDKSSIRFSDSLVFEIKDNEGNVYLPRVIKGKQSCWRWSQKKVLADFDQLVFKNGKVYTKYYRPNGVTPKSLLIDAVYGRTESGNDDIKSLFDGMVFSYPKPINLVSHLASIATDSDGIILDFFSGSATTAHAVMQLNAEDGGNRQFIMVQLPEKTDPSSEAYKAGFENICEIGKERIRRAAKKIAEDHPDKPFDGGFRVLKVADSNMEDVFYHPEAYDQKLLVQMESNIKPDRTALDLLFGCLIDWGLPLSMPYRAEEIEGYTVHNYNDGDLIACFDDNVSESVVKAIAKLQPLRAVFRDSGFESSPAKINVGEIFKCYAPNTRVKVI
ncbi:site-specific DNA-methyltransferase [Pasteurellaceae bacterium HPA106]|uniref:site-specific DNA-methyltransferase n=1 Tax=Spirabiliibacterium pneumoniae TaxID=221400 RepID=UPI001AAD635E|nr:site-specific DNA-methyltransferase [Spirabiliibacterium pneumoniae]MBE2896638.1 site-specific DNA-methyltransferase [Spirabiliibacterium pneumoniae]